MKKMKIVAVCGFGVGSSVILKIKLTDVLKEMGIAADVVTTDLTTASSEQADLFVTSKEIGAQMTQKTDKPVAIVSNFLNKDEIRLAIEKTVESFSDR